MAQDPALPGWQHRVLEPGTETYTAPDGLSVIMLVDMPGAGATAEGLVQSMVTPLRSSCPQFASAPLTRTDGMVRVVSRGSVAQCIVLIRQSADTLHSAVLITGLRPAADFEPAMRTMLVGRSGGDGASQPAPPAAPAPLAQSPADLLAMLDKVPVETRPVAMVARTSYEVLSGFTMKPWTLFANGVAISGECATYSPLSGPPTLALVEQGDCDARRWRGSGEALVMIDSDGETIENDNPAGEAVPFTRGQQVDLAAVTHGFTQIGTGDPYTTTTSISRSGMLRLTPDGRFGGSAARSVQSIGGLVFERPNRRSEAFDGHYALDGFLIAIADPAGEVTVKPMGIYREDGDDLVYYEGDIYMAED